MSQPAYRAFDVVYHVHDKPLLARLYLPASPLPYPAVVEVHGGGWTSNDRLTNKAIHEALVLAGIAVMAIDFRMPPEAQYPASVSDANVAIRWLKANAPAFGIVPDQVGALGTSSGGQQMLLAMMKPFDAKYAALDLTEHGTAHGNTDATVPFAIACWPVADPLARYHMVKERKNQRLIDAHHAYWPDEAAMAEGSPQLLLDRGEAVQLPPVLLLQGTNDDNLPADSADRFAAAYAKRGGEIHVEKFQGEPHTFVSRDPDSPASRKALAMMVDFVKRHTGRA